MARLADDRATRTSILENWRILRIISCAALAAAPLTTTENPEKQLPALAKAASTVRHGAFLRRQYLRRRRRGVAWHAARASSSVKISLSRERNEERKATNRKYESEENMTWQKYRADAMRGRSYLSTIQIKPVTNAEISD
jgi:hypothetical protein